MQRDEAASQLERRTRAVHLVWGLYWGSLAMLMLSTMAGVSYLTSLQKLWPKQDGAIEASVDKTEESDRKPPAEKAGE